MPTPGGERILVIGYGNPGRMDDGLGPALAEALATSGLEGITVEADYQLQIEHAFMIAEHDAVIFADADRQGEEPFSFRRLEPEPELSFTSHSLSPGTVLTLAGSHFGARPRAFVLAIRGYEFDGFGEDLTARARVNLEAAAEFLLAMLRDRSLVSRSAEGVMKWCARSR
jgi:hydrogenase maturation protease